jgi:hypothetical protein
VFNPKENRIFFSLVDLSDAPAIPLAVVLQICSTSPNRAAIIIARIAFRLSIAQLRIQLPSSTKIGLQQYWQNAYRRVG